MTSNPNAQNPMNVTGTRLARWRIRWHALTILGCVSASIASSVEPVIPYRARPLPISAVRLTGGPLKKAQDLDADYLLKLEPDRMLAYFRTRAGLEARGQPYGGWDGDGKNLTGHIAGHYLSAVSLMWAATGDPPTAPGCCGARGCGSGSCRAVRRR